MQENRTQSHCRNDVLCEMLKVNIDWGVTSNGVLACLQSADRQNCGCLCTRIWTHSCFIDLSVAFLCSLHHVPVLHVAHDLEVGVQPAAVKSKGPGDVPDHMYYMKQRGWHCRVWHLDGRMTAVGISPLYTWRHSCGEGRFALESFPNIRHLDAPMPEKNAHLQACLIHRPVPQHLPFPALLNASRERGSPERFRVISGDVVRAPPPPGLALKHTPRPSSRTHSRGPSTNSQR